jgi:tRNA nucleotidyltransferase/poly(A) polymerase
LAAAGIAFVPTGIEHGTVTAIVEGKPFEVTTLRRDVTTDGRHAVVAFTDDWCLDAQRRDFTMNALYADASGEVFDFIGGILESLAKIDAATSFTPDALLRLTALLAPDKALAGRVADRWKLSNEARARLADIAGGGEKIVPDLSVREARKLLYRLGVRPFKDRLFLQWAEDGNASNAVSWRALLALADAWERPHFPLSGRDVMRAGVPEGPLVGQVLGEVEEWWIGGDFAADKSSLAERLKAAARAVAH